MPKVEILSEFVSKIGDGSIDNLETRAVKPGEIWKVRQICFELEETSTPWLALYVYDGVTKKPLKVSYALFTDTAYEFMAIDWQGEMYLREGERILAYTETAPDECELRLFVLGERLKEE